MVRLRKSGKRSSEDLPEDKRLIVFDCSRRSAEGGTYASGSKRENFSFVSDLGFFALGSYLGADTPCKNLVEGL
jgi:hypothetical protein